jgi:hypothetical protein
VLAVTAGGALELLIIVIVILILAGLAMRIWGRGPR